MKAKPLLPLLLGALFFLITGCQAEAESPLPTAALQVTSAPTATATSAPPAVLYLLWDESADEALHSEIEGALADYASGAGLDLQRLAEPAAIDFSRPPFAVVALGEYPDLAQVAASQPETRMIHLKAEGNPGAPPNLIALSVSTMQSEAAAFIAGYAAALSTDDWRVAALYLPEEVVEARAFLAGAEYFCGACAPVAPPYNDYPQAIQTDLASWQFQADEAIEQGARSVYLSPGLKQPEIYEYLAARGLLLVGANYPGEALADSWLASIAPASQSTLVEALIAALEGGGADSSAGWVLISEANAELLSAPRQEHLEAVAADIEAGFIALPSELD